jgi:tripartite-type tricarboxylate transporter receptor subunit TctC
MSRTLGQQMVIENVAGAKGTLGSARVATAQPDGYTLLAGSMGSHVAAPVLTPNIKYDSERDFEPIGLTAHSPAVIVARKDFAANNPSEFIHGLPEAKRGENKAGPRRNRCLFAYGRRTRVLG